MMQFGRLLAGGSRQVFNIAKMLVHRALGLPGAIVDLLGFRHRKRIRLCVRILRNEDGTPVVDVADVADALATAQRIFLDHANVVLEPLPLPGKPSTDIVADPSPTAALEVHCLFQAWREDLACAGGYFQQQRAKTFYRSLFGYGAPVTVFIVRDVQNYGGCSLGILTDYVTVAPVGLKARKVGEDGLAHVGALAHEVAHACGLWHVRARSNIMHPTSCGAELSHLQKMVFRNSRHVTYW